MAPPKMYTNSTVNSSGWIVTSESCMGSREMCTMLRRVMAQMSASDPRRFPPSWGRSNPVADGVSVVGRHARTPSSS